MLLAANADLFNLLAQNLSFPLQIEPVNVSYS